LDVCNRVFFGNNGYVYYVFIYNIFINMYSIQYSNFMDIINQPITGYMHTYNSFFWTGLDNDCGNSATRKLIYINVMFFTNIL